MTTVVSTDFTGSNGAAWPSPWTTLAGTATIQSNRGQQTTSASQWTDCVSKAGVTVGDGRVTATCRFPTATAGKSMRINVRYNPATGNGYRIIIPGDYNGLQLLRVDAYAETELGADWSATWSADTDYRVAFDFQGSTLRVKRWTVGASEPTTWNVSVTDATYSSGDVALSTVTSVASAQSALWDDVLIEETAATTPVTGSVSSGWNVRAAVTASKAAAWNTRGQVTATRQATWNVRGRAAQSAAATWNVRISVAATRSSTWATRQAATAAQAATWTVRAVVASTRATSWNVAARVARSDAATWAVRVAVAKTAASAWHVRARVTTTRQSTWNVSQLGQVITYTGSSAVFPNPERGFFQYTETHYNSDGTGHTPLSAATLAAARAADGRSLVFRYCVIEKYLTVDTIDQAYLDLLAADLTAARYAGCKLILRFTYSTSGDMTPPYGADPPVARVVSHIAQLAATINAHADVVDAVEAGFIGMWGEWYYSDNFGDLGSYTAGNWADRRAVLETEIDEFDPSIWVLVRYPGIVQHLYGETPTSPYVDRIGYHNDAFLAAADDWGTYSLATSMDVAGCRAWLAAQTGNRPMGGESANPNAPRSELANALAELEAYHWTFLNPLYHADVLTSWGAEGRAEVARRLGYRLRLTTATLPTDADAGADVQVAFTVANDGYAAGYRPRPVQLIFKSATHTYVRTLVADWRDWAAGSTVTVTETVEAPPIAGTYDLHINLPDPNIDLATDPAYSVQLANTDVWDDATGWNDLGAAVDVAATTTPVTAGQAATWQVRGTVATARASTWRTAAQTAAAVAATWAVRQAVLKQQASAWAVRSAIAAGQASTWRTAVHVSRSTPSTWAVRQTAIGQQAASWAVRERVVASRPAAWAVRGHATKVASCTWNVRARATATVAAAWRVDAHAVTPAPRVTCPRLRVTPNRSRLHVQPNRAALAVEGG